MSLRIVPISLRGARAFVAQHHRHHDPPRGHKFSVGVTSGGHLAGVAITGRPLARCYDDGLTLEVLRTATDGTPNACSMLYGASLRAARALGYQRLITYTMPGLGETGASLRAAGWRMIAERPPRQGWDTPSRPRADSTTAGMVRWLWQAAS